jgi:hypothetical protein
MTETTPDQLAALDQAAAQGVWEAHLLDGAAYMVSRPNSASTIQAETVDDLRLAATLVNAYRANQIAVIGPDAVKQATDAIRDIYDPGAELAEQLYSTAWISHVHNQAQRDKAAREILRLREQVAQAKAAEHTRLTNLIPPDRKIDTRGTVADSDGDDGA